MLAPARGIRATHIAMSREGKVALKAEVGSLEDVPEGVRDFYQEDGDVFRLDVEGVEFPDEVDGLKSALEKERKARKKYEGDYRELQDKIPDDFDVERWQELTEAEKDRERKKAEERGEYEKLVQQVKEQKDKQIAELEERYNSLQRKREQDFIERELVTEASEQDAHAGLLVKHARDFVRFTDRDGDRVPVIVDEDGDRMLTEDGDEAGFSYLVSWMKEQDRFAPLFKPSGATGGGASGNGAGAGGAKVQSKAELPTRADKLAFIKEHGDEAYLALPES